MKMKHDIDEILNRCEADISRGSSIADCAKKYDYAVSDLEAVLQGFKLLKSACRPEPSVERKQQLRSRLLTELEFAEPELSVADISIANIYNRFKGTTRNIRWSKQPIIKHLAIIVLTLFVLSGSTIAMAGNSQPGSLFYPVKRMAETVRIKMARNDISKGILYVDITQTRITEYMALGPDDPNRQNLEEDIKKDFENAEILASEHSRVHAAFRKMQARNKGVLYSIFRSNGNGNGSEKGIEANQSQHKNWLEQKENPAKQNPESSISTTAGGTTNQNSGSQNKYKSGKESNSKTTTCTTVTDNKSADKNSETGAKGNGQGMSEDKNGENGNNVTATTVHTTSSILETNNTTANKTQPANEAGSQEVNAQSTNQEQAGAGAGSGQNSNGSNSNQNNGSGNQYRGGN